MIRKLSGKLKESAYYVLPIILIVFLLHLFIVPMPLGVLMLFVTGSVLLIVGISIFTLGAETAMMPMGELIGSKLTESRKLWLILGGCFLLGTVLTLAEPDLQVLTRQVPAVPDLVLVSTVSLGVGAFLVLAVLRILFQIRLSHMFLVLYGLVFITAAFTAPDFLAVGFDASGVTTGPVTVPVILALGVGISAVRGGKSSLEDSFGLCAICSIGPILAVLIMGMFYESTGTGYAFETVSTVSGVGELVKVYLEAMLSFFKEVSLVLLPVVAIFGVVQATSLMLPVTQLIKIGVGIVYTLIGLTLFLTGVNIGFMPAGTYLGFEIVSLPYNWILIPLSMVIGFFVVAAEPAVYILNKKVEEVTSGAISRKMIMTGLSIGVGIALALDMIRIMTGISIWYFLLPCYAIALLLAFFVPRIFTSVAFDSGGVAAGSMAAAFLLPFAVGASNALGGNVMTDAFGIIAMVAMMPLVTVQIMGLLYKIKMRRVEKREENDARD